MAVTEVEVAGIADMVTLVLIAGRCVRQRSPPMKLSNDEQIIYNALKG